MKQTICPSCGGSLRTESLGWRCKKYSAYSAKDEMPVLIYASAKECAEFMGITENAFFRFVCRMRSGKYKQRKWLVYEDEE